MISEKIKTKSINKSLKLISGQQARTLIENSKLS